MAITHEVIGDRLLPEAYKTTSDDVDASVDLLTDGTHRVHGALGNQLLAYRLQQIAEQIDPSREPATTAKEQLWQVLGDLLEQVSRVNKVWGHTNAGPALIYALLADARNLRTVIGQL